MRVLTYETVKSTERGLRHSALLLFLVAAGSESCGVTASNYTVLQHYRLHALCSHTTPRKSKYTVPKSTFLTSYLAVCFTYNLLHGWSLLKVLLVLSKTLHSFGAVQACLGTTGLICWRHLPVLTNIHPSACSITLPVSICSIKYPLPRVLFSEG